MGQGSCVRVDGGRGSARTRRYRARDSRDCGRASSEARSEGVAPLSTEAVVCRAKRREGRDWLGSRLGLAVGCCHPESPWGGRRPHYKAVRRPVAVGVRSRMVLAMQKVEGSSPFIRFENPLRTAGFRCQTPSQARLFRSTRKCRASWCGRPSADGMTAVSPRQLSAPPADRILSTPPPQRARRKARDSVSRLDPTRDGQETRVACSFERA